MKSNQRVRAQGPLFTDEELEAKEKGREGERDMKNQAGYIKMIKTTT